jgi:hypothetical protein
MSACFFCLGWLFPPTLPPHVCDARQPELVFIILKHVVGIIFVAIVPVLVCVVEKVAVRRSRGTG